MSKEKLSQDIPKKYDPEAIEERWYDYWTEHNHFQAEVDEDSEPFTIMMPPPNVTGRLHIGHALQSSVQDAVIRIKRMQGHQALWLPGTDHAGIATQNVVERNLKEEEGKDRHDIGREAFVERAWDWKERYGEIIIDQMKRLGTSCDWSRERFTMDEGLSEAVQEAFIQLYEDGLIYRGNYLVNWCPVDQTALSNEEVDHKEVQGHLWYVKYKLSDETAEKTGQDYIEIATTRPETIPADTAIAVHPEDERFKDFIGGKAFNPTNGRSLPIIVDEDIESEFGTGALKVTPAHDETDFEIGQRNDLEIINILNIDGTLNENAGEYADMDRFDARDQVVEDLKKEGLIAHTEEYTHQVGVSSRSDAVIEPLLSTQWFVKMKPLAEKALEASRNGDFDFFPPRWEKEFFRWLENIKDWVISRQLWWGHRIPVWYYTDENGDIDPEQGYVVNREQPEEGMVQDPDVLDTWFSSWLWPFSTLGWPEDTRDYRYFYPTDLLVSGYDILFFWIARMIMAGLHFTDKSPFHDIFITGMVKDKHGRWMSKSLGNGIDPLEMIDEYGADAVRYCLIILCAQGQDIKLDPTKFEMGRNFANKIWNAFRFLAMNSEEGREYKDELEIDQDSLVDRWMMARIHQTIKQVDDDLSRYRLNEALQKIYALVWDDFCDWYIELIKPEQTDENIPYGRLSRALNMFEILLKLLHPFMPYITEEIWQRMRERTPEEALIKAKWPTYKASFDQPEDTHLFSTIQQMISSARRIRSEMNVPDGAEITLLVNALDNELEEKLNRNEWIFRKMLKLDELKIATDISRPENSAADVVNGSEIYLPLEGLIDFKKERERIHKEIDRLEGFLKSINGKLNNEQFIENAPDEVVEREKQKKMDTETNLEKLRKNLKNLGSS